MNYRFHHRSFRNLTRALLCIAALAATTLGCVWLGAYDSVRFSGIMNYHEMERLPPLPDFADDPDTKNKEPGEEQNQLREYSKRAGVSLDEWLKSGDLTSSASIDKFDALTALNQGSPFSHVQAYLVARKLHDEGEPKEKVEEAVSPAEADVNLKDNVAYLKAAELYGADDLEEASRAFSDLARMYPHSEKREAALFMAALAIMKTSLAYTPTSGDEAHLHEDEDKGETRDEVTLDDAWRAALAGFKRVMAEYPHGRYFNDARGWVAYLMLRKGDRAAALVEYYRMLSDQRDEGARMEAVRSLCMVRHHATDEELSRVEEQLADEPQVALTYAYHSIYNYSIDPGLAYPEYESVKDAKGDYDTDAADRLRDGKIQEWNKNRAAITQATAKRVVAFSGHLMDRYPKLAVGGAFASRVAEANLELGNNDDAVRFGKRALQSGVQNNERTKTLWTIGVAEHHLQHFVSARKNLETLIHDYPASDLITGARRLLAMVAEDSGDLDGALEQYLALKYTPDVAYFVDVLMTSEQLAQFVDHHPNVPEKNELTYSLGLRYLRANLWNDARATFAKIHGVKNPDGSFYGCLGRYAQCSDPKEPREIEEGSYGPITHELLMLDIQTANDLERLEQTVTRAPDNESTAEALFVIYAHNYITDFDR